MNEAALMGMLHPVADPGHKLHPLPDVQMLRISVGPQRLAPDVLHREKWLRTEARVRRTGFIDLRDADVLQSSECLRFEREAAQKVGRCQFRPDDLEGDSPPGMILFGFAYCAHASLAQQSDDPISADFWGEP